MARALGFAHFWQLIVRVYNFMNMITLHCIQPRSPVENVQNREVYSWRRDTAQRGKILPVDLR